MRHFHKTVGWVGVMLPTEFADLEPFAADVVPRHRARTVGPAHGQHDGRDAGVLRRVLPARRGSDRVLRPVPARRRCPTTPRNLMQLLHSLILVSYSVEVWQQVEPVNVGSAVMDRFASLRRDDDTGDP